MNTQVKPGIAIIAILLVMGAAVAIMFNLADRKPPHIPNGPSGMGGGGGGGMAQGKKWAKQGKSSPAEAAAKGDHKSNSPTAKASPTEKAAAEEDASDDSSKP